jgi:RNA-directed DNA polymerase
MDIGMDPSSFDRPRNGPRCSQTHQARGRVANKYFLNRKGQWQFHGWQKIANMDCQFNLVQIAQTPIKRHVKIRSAVNPYDPEFAGYLSQRKQPEACRNSRSEPVQTAF